MIAISYRREDSRPVTGRLYDRLQAEFGRGNVFIDIESIPFGVDFRDKIKHTLERARVVIAVIGPSWAGSRDAGKRRIDDPTDFVRMEIAAALQRGIPVIPVLLDNTVMPSVEDLPEELRLFAYRNALVLDTGVDFHHHADRLIAGIHEVVDGGPPGKRKGRPFIKGTAPQKAKIGEIIPYALVALASFLCGIGVLGLMLWKAEALTKLGLIGNLYYVVLLPLGLCAAVFFFGVVRSFARYKGEQYGGNLELGAPIVAFVLVVGGGFVLVPKPPSTFPLTVYVHGEAARNDLVLRNSGRVFVDLDGDRQSRSIGENGEAYFPAIPDRFRGQEVPIWVDATGFESTIADQKQRVDGGSLYLAVRKKSGHVSGRVQDQDGNPISGAELSVAGVLTHSGVSGHFELIIPGDKLEQEMDLQAVAHGYKAQKYKVVPNANELTITLPTAP